MRVTRASAALRLFANFAFARGIDRTAPNRVSLPNTLKER